jgi:streptogramin lyase
MATFPQRTLRTLLATTLFLPSFFTARAALATDPAQGCVDGTAVTKNVGAIAFTQSGDLLMSSVNGRNILNVQRGTRIVTLASGMGTTSLPALDSFFDQRDPFGMTTDKSGNTYLLTPNRVIYKIDSHGHGSVFAGTGESGYSGDGGPATQAKFDAGYGWGENSITSDSFGNIFFSDSQNNVVRKIDTSGNITTVIGGSAARPQLSNPRSITADANGNIYVNDSGEDLILKRNSAGAVSVVAGSNSQTIHAETIASDVDGNIYFQSSDSDGINKIDHSTGAITLALFGATFAHGTMAINAAGNVFIGSPNTNIVQQFNIRTGVVSKYAGMQREFGQGGLYGYNPVGTPANVASFNYANGLAIDNAGSIYFGASGWTQHLVKIDASTKLLSYVVGQSTDSEGFSGDGGQATSAKLKRPTAVTVDSSGNVFFIDQDNNRIRKVTQSSGVISTFAGDGTAAFTTGSQYAGITNANANRDIALAQENGIATSSELFLGDSVNFIDVDDAGNVYFTNKTDFWGSLSQYGQIRKITTDGKIHTIAGNGTSTYISAMNNQSATSAGISKNIQGLVVDRSNGDVYFSDNRMIHKIHNGIITTVATFLQDNQAGALALNAASHLLYFYDVVNYTIGSIDLSTTPATVSSSVLAGGGTSMYAPDGSSPTSVALGGVEQMVYSPISNRLLISDRLWEVGNHYENNVSSQFGVQAIDLAQNAISTVVSYVPTVPAGGTSFGCVLYTSIPTISQGENGSQFASIPPRATIAVFSDISLGNAVLRFSAASSSASVSIAPVANPVSASATPFAINASTKVVDIQVTGVNGDVTVCLDGAPTDHLFHFAGGSWVDLPQRTYVDGQVCGVTSSFSPFAAATPQAITVTPSTTVAPTTTVSPSTTLAPSVATSVAPAVVVIGAKKTYVAKSLAKLVGVAIVSSKAVVTLSPSKATSKVCTLSSSKLKTLKAGNCTLTITVQEPTPKNGKKPVAKRIKMTLVVK